MKKRGVSLNNIAIITARGGSKRIPHKNIKNFCGKPIISYSIEAALQSELFSEVMVSTDSEEIADIAKRYGAVVPFLRSERTSDDFATTADVLKEVLECYRERGSLFDIMVCIYPTAPFVTSEKLKNAMEILISEGVCTVMPVVSFSFPPQRGFWLRNGRLQITNSDSFYKRSQDLEKIYHDAGQFYCYNVNKFLDGDDDTLPIIVSEMEVQDIDTEDDWKLAELKYSLMKNGGN